MKTTESKRVNRISRHTRLRAKLSGTADKPRIHVFRSNQHVYVQVIDDTIGKTLISISDVVKGKAKKAGSANKSDSAKEIGSTVGKKMAEKGIKEAVFDRGGFKYHGRIKAVAESIREAGIKF